MRRFHVYINEVFCVSELPLIKVSLNVIASLFSSFCLVFLCFFPLSKTIQVSFSNSTKIYKLFNKVCFCGIHF